MSGAAHIEDVLALTPLQEGLFALYRMAQDSVDPYTMQLRIDIDGPVDVTLLRRSVAALLERHPNLRAAFWDRDVPRPVQIVPTRVQLPWAERTVTARELDSIARSERHRPFDLSKGPAIRVVLLTIPGETRRRMIFTVHHILVDGWGLAVFFTEMLAIYRAGGTADALPNPRPYRDYIVWLAAQDRAAATATWAEYLRATSGPLMIAEPTRCRGGVPDTTDAVLPAAETTRLRAWAARNGLTLNTAVLFAWAVVLSRLTDRRDVVFGTVVSGRPEHLAGVETMVGLFINSVPVVHHVSGTTSVLDQCARLQRESSAMRDIGYLSLSELQRAHGVGALFDTMFVFENAPLGDTLATATAPDGATFTPVQAESLTHYPLTVVSHLRDDALVVVAEVITDALPHLSAEAICERLLGVLRALPDVGDRTPDALDVLTAAEHAEFSRHAAADVASAVGVGDTVWETFERQVRATPHAAALATSGGERLSYAELHADACRLAVELTRHGVGPETVVALLLPRSALSIVAILAVLAAGAAYVPVDVTLPAARIESIFGQANPVLALTDGDHTRLVGAGRRSLILDDPAVVERISSSDALAPTVRRHPGHSAYVIFTSGSTGEPKGVIGTNAAILSYFADHRERVYRRVSTPAGRRLRIAHAWSLSFDASWQPLVGLLDGHCVHLFDPTEMRDARLLAAGMAAYGIDVLDTTPSMFAQLRAAGLLDRKLAALALGGEAINPALWDDLRGLPGSLVVNCYGPTETTVEAVVAPVQEYSAPTIGTVNAGTFGYVLDSALRRVPHGVVGELYLSGAQLARGYVSRSAMTSDRFVANPFRAGERMYRTGDLVRRLPHGGYAYLDRADTQVKIRGYRVEIGEIEAALRGQPHVRDAAVSVLRRAGGVSLVGFVVWQDAGSGDPALLRDALAELLPPYMVPARIVALRQLPVNVNGKLDGPALHTLAGEAMSGRTATAAAVTGTQRVLCDVFEELFDGVVPDVDDDFFTLGMDSIVAIAFVGKARRRGLALSPRMLSTAPTVRSLAAAIDGAAAHPEAALDGPRDGTEHGGCEYGAVPPLPTVSWLCEYGNYRRFTHNFLLRLPSDVDGAAVETILQLLLDGHDTLRSIVADGADGPQLVTREPGAVRAADVLEHVELADGSEDELLTAVAESARTIAEVIDPHAGVMVRATWISGAIDGPVLLLAAHHLTVDVVSWHVMLGDVVEAARALAANQPPKTVPEFTSYRRWSQLMWQRAATPQVRGQRAYWTKQVRGDDPVLGTRRPDPGRDTWSTLHVTRLVTSAVTTARLLTAAGRDEGVHEILLAATTMTIASWRRARAQDPAAGALIALEGHGRADDVVGADTANTVGAFTASFPVRLGAGAAVDVEQAEEDPRAAQLLLESVVTELTAIPNGGLDYGLLRYVDRTPELLDTADPQVLFSYLGRLDLSGSSGEPWSLLTEPYVEALPLAPEPDLPLRFALHVSALVANTAHGTQLVTTMRWSDALFTPADIAHLGRFWERSIAVLAQGAGTPSASRGAP